MQWEVLLESQFLDAENEKEDCSIFLEKTPRHIWHVDYVKRVVPDAKFILMTRDGRDVVASLYERTGDIHGAILRYKDDSLLTIRQLDNHSAVLVRYEDLIANPRIELINIMNFLELKFEDSMLNFHKNTVNWFNLNNAEKGTGEEGVEHDKLRNWQVNQPIFSQSKQWNERIPKKYLTEVDDFFEECGNNIMQKLGYL